MKTKTVFTANKGSYGLEFFEVCDTLEDLKKAIVEHTYMFDKEKPEYSEALFKKCVKTEIFSLYEIELRDDEYVSFDGYDGTSWFTIKKNEILSEVKRVEI